MPVPLEQFVRQLSESGVISPEEIEAARSQISAELLNPADAQPFARELIRQRKLTAYQATAVYKGQGGELVYGTYVVLDKLGQGGMGTVFKAEHRRMKRIVALKVMSPAGMKSADAVKRFHREVEAAAKLTHPHIVAALDADEARGVHFLVMEYVEGNDLAALVKKTGPIPVDKAVQYITQAARGLAHAHQEGVVHRDIKPANLLLDKSGTVKILDMGLARLTDSGTGQAAEGLTQSGSVMGTVDYMSPEQALDTKHADAKSDIYSLGCSLYYLLTGQSVYSGDTLMKKLLAHREQPVPSLRDARPDAPESLAAMFRKFIAKKPEERYASMVDVIRDLEACLAGGAVLAATSSAGWGELSAPSILGSATLGSADADIQEFLRAISPGTNVTNARTRFESSTNPDTLVSQNAGQTDANNPNRRGSGPGQFKTRQWWLTAGGIAIGLCALVGIMVSRAGSNSANRKTAVQPTIAESVSDVPSDEDPVFQKWMRNVANLPTANQLEAVSQKLRGLNPEFDGELYHELADDGSVESLRFVTDHVTDISPIRALPRLRKLWCIGDPNSGLGGKLVDLTPLHGLKLQRLHIEGNQVDDLEPLQGMPLIEFDCRNNRIFDLKPLAGMPLEELDCNGTRIWNLNPLRGMKLTVFGCSETTVTSLGALFGMPLRIVKCRTPNLHDLSPLTGMPLEELECETPTEHDRAVLATIQSLRTVNGQPAAEILGDAIELHNAFEMWKQKVVRLEAEEQVHAVMAKLQEWNPDFDGAETHKIENGVVTELQFFSNHVTDLRPLQALQGLVKLRCHAEIPRQQKAPLTDLWPLVGLPLRELSVSVTNVTDLTPLSQMKLTSLEVVSCHNLSDLSPLSNLPLESLYCGGYTQVTDLTPLKGLPLKNLDISYTGVTDLSPLTGSQLTYLNCALTRVTNLEPIRNMPLETLVFPYEATRPALLVRSMKTLKYINNVSAAEFWKSVDNPSADKK